MFKLDYNHFNSPIDPPFILCKANGDRIGTIKCTSKTYDAKFNDLDEISFSTPMYFNELYNSIYDSLEELMYVLVPDIGIFTIYSVTVESEGTMSESKDVNAKSVEALLGQKYLEDFTINKGTTGSIDGVQLFNLADKDKSLLHIILEKFPEWDIGHVDTAIQTKQRSFETSRTDVYSFMTSDISEAFECIFDFDTLHGLINVYTVDNTGEDTDIHISYNNLLTKTDISCDSGEIKTCLKLTGDDDLTVREVNMGYDRIYNFDYYNSDKFWSDGLISAYEKWKKLSAEQTPKYNELLKQYEQKIEDINYLTHEKMPDIADSEDWTQYGLEPLKEKKSSVEIVLSSEAESGWGKSDNANYSKYKANYDKCEAIKKQIAVVEGQLKTMESERDSIGKQMTSIANQCAIENNFTKSEYTELSKWIREDELSSTNFVVTDSMTTEEKYEMLDEFLSFGTKELAKVAMPKLSFSISIANIFEIPEFRKITKQCIPGNYIYVTLRDNYHVKARMKTLHYNFYDVTDFSITFGDIGKKDKNVFTDITDAIKLAQSTATSVSFNSSKWSEAAKDTDDIGKILDQGLISAGKYISSGANSKMVLDERGMFVNTVDGQYANKDSIFIGGGRILFTDDNWKTVSEAIGRVDIKGNSVFGVLAQAMISGYIAATTIEGSSITSTTFNNGNGTFQVDENGHLKCTDADITGTVKANTGYIGGTQGFTITGDNNKGYLYTNNKTSYNSSTAGVYLGTDGIGLGSGKFYVDSAGNLVCTSATIGGIKVDANSIHSTNGNFKVTDSGYAEFKNVFVSGVNNGSSFGTVSVSDKGTYGNFGNGFAANTSFDVSGGAWSNFKDLVVDSITAKKVLADYVQTSELNAVSARVGSLESDHVSTSDLSATNAEIKNLKSASINVNRLTAGTVNGHKVGWVRIKFANEVHIELNTDGTVRSHGVTYKYMYVMADVEDS
ncbi:MAG: hypothetical protein MSH33_05105 [Fusobacterium necrophorum]|nr:hypothetical protein [Fusobacterium necrophorum]